MVLFKGEYLKNGAF